MVEEVVGVADDPLPGTLLYYPNGDCRSTRLDDSSNICRRDDGGWSLLMTIVSPFPRILKIVVGSGK